jgi:hypothetical protein
VDTSKDDKATYQTKVDDALFFQSVILFAMESKLQKRFEKMGAFEIITDLKVVFAPQAQGSSPPIGTNTIVRASM